MRLAELVFGDDVLEASTVTGGKRGTMQLDPIMIKAIQSMLKQNTKIVFMQTPLISSIVVVGERVYTRFRGLSLVSVR